MSKARCWCFTLNNPDKDELEWGEAVRYAVWQREVGDNGTPHLQGYVEFDGQQRLSGVKKVLERAHWEARRGTRDQARAYAMKEDTRQAGPWEFGDWAAGGQGARTDLETVAAMIKSGAKMTDVADQHPVVYAKFSRGFRELKRALSKPRDFKSRVVVRWGEPGSGKTKWVYDNYAADEVYVKEPGEWFDGYDDHKVVLIDDFYGDLKYTTMLRLLDRYPMQVPVKGGFVNWRPELIVITSNVPPEEWYRNIADKRALARRIEEVVKVGDASYAGHENFLDIGVRPEVDLLEPADGPAAHFLSIDNSPCSDSSDSLRDASCCQDGGASPDCCPCGVSYDSPSSSTSSPCDSAPTSPRQPGGGDQFSQCKAHAHPTYCPSGSQQRCSSDQSYTECTASDGDDTRQSYDRRSVVPCSGAQSGRHVSRVHPYW